MSGKRLLEGELIALISDAGTPLISDPGFHLVRAAREHNINVIPIPGASAIICALSASGLPCDRFIFEGFLPAKENARRNHLELLRNETRTMVFYESPYRISATLADCMSIFGKDRQAVLARELTKLYETFIYDTLGNLNERLNIDAEQHQGELVIIIAGAPEIANNLQNLEQAYKIFDILKAALPPSQAITLTSQITGIRKNFLYSHLIKS